MSDTWVSVPRKAPYKCRRSGRDTEAEGPYFEDSLGYCEAPGDDRELTQYISVGWLKAIADAPGSPIVVLDYTEHQALLAQIDRIADQVEALERQAAEPQETIVSPVDVEALASALVVKLEQPAPKRPGPRPKAAA